MAGGGHHIAARGAVRADDADATHFGVGPGHVDDPLAVTGERRKELERAVLGQSSRLPVGQRLHVQLAECAVDDRLAIR